MCTVIVFHEQGLPFPVVVAANRDELAERPSKPFGANWPGRPWRGGLDTVAGGTWAGLHEFGFGVYVLNQPGALGPDAARRSRGRLVLDLLETGTPEAAEAALRAVDPADYRPCHILIVSATGPVGFTHTPEGWIQVPMSPGVTIWTAAGADERDDARVVAHREAADQVLADWRASGDIRAYLESIEALVGRPAPDGHPPGAALCRPTGEDGFGTRSSLIIAYSPIGSGRPFLVRAADGPPDSARFRRHSVQPG